MSLAGERVVVVGGTSGMGAATVRAARRLGAEVVSAGRRPVAERDGVEGVQEVVVDSTDEASVRALFESVGELDHLLVTASPGQSGVFLDQDLAQARTFMDGKFFGSWTCARYAAPRLRSRGSITFVTGGAVVRPAVGRSMITAAFAAVEALTRALAVELGPRRVNAIGRATPTATGRRRGPETAGGPITGDDRPWSSYLHAQTDPIGTPGNDPACTSQATPAGGYMRTLAADRDPGTGAARLASSKIRGRTGRQGRKAIDSSTRRPSC
jgi:NAD(P)-dependent dehydrogenase (short-subunit alcohol dehydrogenase family)